MELKDGNLGGPNNSAIWPLVFVSKSVVIFPACSSYHMMLPE